MPISRPVEFWQPRASRISLLIPQATAARETFSQIHLGSADAEPKRHSSGPLLVLGLAFTLVAGPGLLLGRRPSAGSRGKPGSWEAWAQRSAAPILGGGICLAVTLRAAFLVSVEPGELARRDRTLQDEATTHHLWTEIGAAQWGAGVRRMAGGEPDREALETAARAALRDCPFEWRDGSGRTGAVTLVFEYTKGDTSFIYAVGDEPGDSGLYRNRDGRTGRAEVVFFNDWRRDTIGERLN